MQIKMSNFRHMHTCFYRCAHKLKLKGLLSSWYKDALALLVRVVTSLEQIVIALLQGRENRYIWYTQHIMAIFVIKKLPVCRHCGILLPDTGLKRYFKSQCAHNHVCKPTFIILTDGWFYYLNVYLTFLAAFVINAWKAMLKDSAS